MARIFQWEGADLQNILGQAQTFLQSIFSTLFTRRQQQCSLWLPVLCVNTEPGVLLVNPIRPCLKINDVPVGWEHFSQRGWDVFEVPPPVTIDGWFSATVFCVLLILCTSNILVLVNQLRKLLVRGLSIPSFLSFPFILFSFLFPFTFPPIRQLPIISCLTHANQLSVIS